VNQQSIGSMRQETPPLGMKKMALVSSRIDAARSSPAAETSVQAPAISASVKSLG
jgi:hypothetical protein